LVWAIHKTALTSTHQSSHPTSCPPTHLFDDFRSACSIQTELFPHLHNVLVQSCQTIFSHKFSKLSGFQNCLNWIKIWTFKLKFELFYVLCFDNSKIFRNFNNFIFINISQ
jgi:hypothetical protein